LPGVEKARKIYQEVIDEGNNILETGMRDLRRNAREYICADKRAYLTMESAKRAFTRYKRATKNWMPQVPYRCDVCKKWHLTKK